MLTSGDVVELELGAPEGREAGFRHPAIVVTAQRILDAVPSVVHVVPLTSTIRPFASEVAVAPDGDNGLDRPSAAQCQHISGVSPGRVLDVRGNVGAVVLTQVRKMIAVILDLPP
jgi:mRNA interferase MazF